MLRGLTPSGGYEGREYCAHQRGRTAAGLAVAKSRAAQPGTLSRKQSTRRAVPCRPTMPTSLARAAEPLGEECERRAGFVGGVWRSVDDDSSSHHAAIEVIRGSCENHAPAVPTSNEARMKLERFDDF